MIKIQNIYYMLAYAYDVLKRDDYKSLGYEDFDYALDLYAAILSIGISNLIKQGLARDYVNNRYQSSHVRGKIDISASIKSQSFIKKQLIFDADNYQEDMLLNQILKTTMIQLLKSEEVKQIHKQKLKLLLMYFQNVNEIRIKDIRWHQITYYKNNVIYKMLINICYLTLHGLLQNQHEKSSLGKHFMDEKKLHSLFERFVLNYYKKHYPNLKPSSPKIKWNTDDGMMELLPTMHTDIVLTTDQEKLIIDTKFYEKMLQKNYVESQHSSNMYQIYSYVKNAQAETEKKVNGMVLYAKAEAGTLPDKTYAIDSHKIVVKSINLNEDFNSISSTLDNIANGYLD